MASLGDFAFIRDRLAAIYSARRGDLLRIAISYGASIADAEEAVQRAYVAVSGLAPQAEVLELTNHWADQPEAIERLADALTALLVYYLRLECLSQFRRNLRDGAAAGGGGAAAADPSGGYTASATVDRARAAVERLRKEGALDQREWEYWLWLAENPDAVDQDFNRGLPAWTIARVKRRLFNKIVAMLEKMRRERKSAARESQQDH